MSVLSSDLLSLFIELNDLKRIASAGRDGSIATRIFGEAWATLVDGTPSDHAGWSITARALAAARLGDIDRSVIETAGISRNQATEILRRAVTTVGMPLPDPVRLRLDDDVSGPGRVVVSDPPAFVAALARQPRAGITCPGKPRILLEPPENHAEHCMMVAVYGMLLAPHYGADPGRVFLAALSHHFHNAGMPDSGFTGEMLLGSHLETLMAYYTGLCLDQLAPALRRQVEEARSILPTADTPEGKAFHAADVLDRVLQIKQYTRAGALTSQQMLGEMALVHEGPVKAFHDGVLREAGLA